MTLEQDIELLSRVELLGRFNVEQLRLLAFGAQKRNLASGEILYRQGARTDCGYVVISGQIDITVNSGEQDTVLDTFGPGSLVGELALITETTRIVTALAREDTRLLRISRTIFRRVLEEFPELAIELHQRISKSVNDFVGQLERVERKLANPGFQ